MRDRPSRRTETLRPTRRDVLRGLAALAASGWMPAGLAQTASNAMSSARFAALSSGMTSFTISDPVVANRLIRALSANVGADKLVQLATLAATVAPAQLGDALKAAGLERAAAVVVAALYTGTVDTPKGPIVISYDQALVWQACAWTKPNAECGGMTNYWVDPPSST